MRVYSKICYNLLTNSIIIYSTIWHWCCSSCWCWLRRNRFHIVTVEQFSALFVVDFLKLRIVTWHTLLIAQIDFRLEIVVGQNLRNVSTGFGVIGSMCLLIGHNGQGAWDTHVLVWLSDTHQIDAISADGTIAFGNL